MRGAGATVIAFLVLAAPALAHDLERTRVVLTFASDGTFTLDLSHDPNWLLLRLESFAGGRVPVGMTPAARDARLSSLGPVVIDRVVLWVDGREIRPDSAEYVAGETTFRLRGRVARDARSLRWLYGPVIDQYPFVVRRADGRTHVELIDGSNWSGTVDLAGQFNHGNLAFAPHLALIVGFFALTLAWRVRSSRRLHSRKIHSPNQISTDRSR